MSLVCFPFKEEDVAVVVRNVELAASHPRVLAVLGVGYSKGETWHAIEMAAPGIEFRTGKKVILLQQRRIGLNLRPGKGDGMNTALAYMLDHPEFCRLHFYDADIISFNGEWITKAETQADEGFEVVRHAFPRPCTDAMITWFVTRVGFSMLWPHSILPKIMQPLGGELLLTRKAVEVLYSDHRVRTQSDWGIDTLYTFVMAQAGLRLAEVYIPEGKVHKKYSGGLRDIRKMIVECFSAIQTLQKETITHDGVFVEEASKPVPDALKSSVSYDIEKSLKLLRENWTPRQKDLIQQHFDGSMAKGLISAAEWPCWSFCDEAAWLSAYSVLLTNFEKGDEDWEEILFKMWVARILNYTFRHALRGYDAALASLNDYVRAIQLEFSGKVAPGTSAYPIIVTSGHSAVEVRADISSGEPDQPANVPII